MFKIRKTMDKYNNPVNKMFKFKKHLPSSYFKLFSYNKNHIHNIIIYNTIFTLKTIYTAKAC